MHHGHRIVLLVSAAFVSLANVGFGDDSRFAILTNTTDMTLDLYWINGDQSKLQVSGIRPDTFVSQKT